MIRQAVENDVPAISRVAENAYADYALRLGKKPASMVADFKKHVSDDWVIVFERCRVLGYAILLVRDQSILLDNIAVDVSAQQQGIGKMLIDHVERYVLERGQQHYDLYTNVVMTANIRWYQELGFSETRRVEEKGFERVYMRKQLTAPPA